MGVLMLVHTKFRNVASIMEQQKNAINVDTYVNAEH
jgi:hypothetical protein